MSQVENVNSSNNSQHTLSSIRSVPSKKSTTKKEEIDSEEIDVSQMELIANKKKLMQTPDDPIISEKKSSKSSSSSSSSTSSTSSNSSKEERKKKQVKKENENEFLRKEKSEYLSKFNRIKTKEKWSSLTFDMNNTLEEIRNEFDRVTNAIKVDRNVQFYKRMLLLGVQGVEMMNTRFDPLGVDLDGWSEAMTYSMDNQEYDDVLSELYEKYKNVGEMSPELKLIFMIVSSGVFFSISKKITKMDSTNGLMNFLGNFMPGQATVPPPATSTSQQQNYQTETVEDTTPSKIPDPQQLQDNISLTNIMNKMKKKQKKPTTVTNEQQEASVISTKTISTSGKRTRKPIQKITRKF